ncbi:MAG: hypothetical protein SGJ27_26580 [Candidatus Melainabacteria bacterium]|nr:hypothetical protein [Candidatus Melainabacteria bacterium]
MRFLKNQAQAAHLVAILQESASKPRPAKKGKRQSSQPVVLVNPRIIAKGPSPGTVTLDFRHHLQCGCSDCIQQRQPRKKRSRKGSR